MKAVAAGQGKSKKFSAQFGNDAVQNSVSPYTSGQFFKDTANTYFPNGKPAWMSYQPGSGAQSAPGQKQAAAAPTQIDTKVKNAVSVLKQQYKATDDKEAFESSVKQHFNDQTYQEFLKSKDSD
jgi:hypothetical protein